MWPFCPSCGCLLELTPKDDGTVSCPSCRCSVPIAGFGDKEVVTTSRPRPMPQWLREQLYSDDGASKRTRAKVNEECPKCGHPEMEFWTVQLRSVDEGQTVFYECLNSKCRHTSSVNN